MLSTHQIALPTGRREVVRPLPGHRGRTWHTAAGEYVQSWSPDDRYLLTAVDPGPFRIGGQVTPTSNLRIRNAATGVIAAEFRGLLGVDTEFHHSPVWETSGTFLASAWSSYDADEDHPALVGGRTIRCSVSTVTCERVAPGLDAEVGSANFSTFAVPRNK